MANSNLSILNPDKNPILKSVLRNTMYPQFCAGETPSEVRRTIADLKRIGYAGVILGYGREVVMDGAETLSMREPESDEKGGKAVAEEKKQQQQEEEEGEEEEYSAGSIAEQSRREIEEWKRGTLQTVNLADTGDFVALKLTGAGREALRHLVQGLSPSPTLRDAIYEICDRAKDRKIQLLFDAEQHAVQDTINSWVLDLQRKYNKSFTIENKPRALIYNTYQAYLRATPEILAGHLLAASQTTNPFVVGVKLVRGAYLDSDPRELFWANKQETDRAYDTIAQSLMTRNYRELMNLQNNHSVQSAGKLQDLQINVQVDLVLASHNQASVEKARALRDEQTRRGEPLIEMVYGQLQGMADDISCPLVQQSLIRSNQLNQSDPSDRAILGECPQPYKYLVWGSVGECSKYLLRRGQENRDAALRTKATRTAMWEELKRRVWSRGKWVDILPGVSIPLPVNLCSFCWGV